MRGPQGRGTPTERAVAAELRALGYLIGSRRHEPGPGDLLALDGEPPFAGHPPWPPLLVEVKGTLDPPWRSKGFGPLERRALIETAREWGMEPILAWRPPNLGATIWLPPEDWPPS